MSKKEEIPDWQKEEPLGDVLTYDMLTNVIFDLLKSTPGPITEDDIATHFGIPGCSITGCLKPLLEKGLIKIVGKRGRSQLYELNRGGE